MNNYKSDLYFCALLDSLGATLDEVDKSNPKRIQWIYSGNLLPCGLQSIGMDGSKQIAEIAIQDYDQLFARWNERKILVNAFLYANSLKKLKITLYD